MHECVSLPAVRAIVIIAVLLNAVCSVAMLAVLYSALHHLTRAPRSA